MATLTTCPGEVAPTGAQPTVVIPTFDFQSFAGSSIAGTYAILGVVGIIFLLFLFVLIYNRFDSKWLNYFNVFLYGALFLLIIGLIYMNVIYIMIIQSMQMCKESSDYYTRTALGILTAILFLIWYIVGYQLQLDQNTTKEYIFYMGHGNFLCGILTLYLVIARKLSKLSIPSLNDIFSNFRKEFSK